MSTVAPQGTPVAGVRELPSVSWIRQRNCRMLPCMTVSAETWGSYAQLLQRLNPGLEHIVFAAADGSVRWANDTHAAALLRATLSTLRAADAQRQQVIEARLGPDGSYGFRIRGGEGEVLGLVGLAQRRETVPFELAAMHALLGPALECLSSELTARAAIGELHENLADHGRDLDLMQRLSDAAPADGFDALEQIPQLALEHLSGMFAAMLLPDRDMTLSCTRAGHSRATHAGVLAQMHRHLVTRAQLHGCTLVANKLLLDGETTPPYKALSTPVRDDARHVVGVLAVFRVDSEPDFQLRDAEALERLARKATQIIRTSFDALTGLLTQSAFLAQTAERLAHGLAPRLGLGSPVPPDMQAAPATKHGLLYIDIDQLNVVNENLGMPVGDEIIQGVGALLARRVRDGALVARIGGDRFVLFAPGLGVEPTARIAEELRSAAIRLSGARGDKPILVSLSIGVAGLGDGDRRLNHALATAELACRTAKERGRNRVEIYHADIPATDGRRALAGFAAQVAAALAADSFELLAQPVLPLRAAPADPRFEILVRLRAADGSRLGLEKLASLPDCQDLLRAIDRWVIDRALARLAACGAVLRLHPARFSVNITAASLGSEEFWRWLEDRVRSARIEPGTVSFEFPEAAASEHVAVLAPVLRRLREQGVTFALDNVGRGIGSLSNLNALPVSCIKIDGSFSRDLLGNPQAQSRLLAMTQLARTFNLETVAGNVETDAIRGRAAQLGVDYGQGFFIGRPLALDDVLRDLPLYACFATSTGLFEAAVAIAV